MQGRQTEGSEDARSVPGLLCAPRTGQLYLSAMPCSKSVKDIIVKCFLLVTKITMSLVKQDIFKALCYSRAVNKSRNTSTPADHFAHSSAPVSGTGTWSRDGLLAATLSARQGMKIQRKRWIHLNLSSYSEKNRKLLRKGLWLLYLFPLWWLLTLNTCSWVF